MQTFIPPVGFEPKISVFGRAKTVHTVDSSATVIGVNENYRPKISRETIFKTRNSETISKHTTKQISKTFKEEITKQKCVFSANTKEKYTRKISREKLFKTRGSETNHK
jgi:hypothetical protein